MLRFLLLKKKHKLSSSVIRWLMIIGVALIVVTSINVGVQYIQEYIGHTQQEAFGYAKNAAEYIDGDSIPRYAQTLEKDEYYHEVSRFFNTVQKQTNLKYYL